MLSLRGHGPWPARPAVAIVGARAATAYARRVAFEVAQACAHAGVCVGSGLARGVDAAAHAGALAGQGTTVAVLGTGIDVVYPPEHASLYAAVRANGTLVTALPAGAPPRRGHFPARNRVLAALCDGVVLVQADANSGAHHTVRAALAGGAWARIAPWPLDDVRYAGNAGWLARGAAGVAPLLDSAEPARSARISRTARAAEGGGAAASDSPSARLQAALGSRGRTLDALARSAGLGPAEAAVAALELELAGIAQRMPGDCYRRGRG